MRIRIIIGLLILTSCATYQKKPLIFIPSFFIAFSQREDSTQSILKPIYERWHYNENGVTDGVTLKIVKDGDSLTVGSDYNLVNRHFPGSGIKIRRLVYPDLLHLYYLSVENKQFIDFIVFYYYDKELYQLKIFTKQPKDIDSLLSSTEDFYEKKFAKTHNEWTNFNTENPEYGPEFKMHYGQWTSEYGSFVRNGFYVSFLRDYIFDESVVTITNTKLRVKTRYI